MFIENRIKKQINENTKNRKVLYCENGIGQGRRQKLKSIWSFQVKFKLRVTKYN